MLIFSCKSLQYCWTQSVPGYPPLKENNRYKHSPYTALLSATNQTTIVA